MGGGGGGMYAGGGGRPKGCIKGSGPKKGSSLLTRCESEVRSGVFLELAERTLKRTKEVEAIARTPKATSIAKREFVDIFRYENRTV